MANNLESDVKYIPYKEVIKKRALEYYYADKEVISHKRKDKYKQLPIEGKKSCKSIIKNGLIRKCLKQFELRQKARKYYTDKYDNMMVRVN